MKICCPKIAILMISSDLNSYYHAWNDLIWQVSMDEEMNSLQKNTTWELVSLPLRKEIGSMQVGVLEKFCC